MNKVEDGLIFLNSTIGISIIIENVKIWLGFFILAIQFILLIIKLVKRIITKVKNKDITVIEDVNEVVKVTNDFIEKLNENKKENIVDNNNQLVSGVKYDRK